MATWLILLALFVEGYSPPWEHYYASVAEGVDGLSDAEVNSIEQARKAYQTELSILSLQKASTEQAAKNVVGLKWSQSVSSVPTHYLVSGPNCKPCVQRETALTQQGVKFKKITVAEAMEIGRDRKEDWFLRKNKYIPFEFDAAAALSSVVLTAESEKNSNVAIHSLTDFLLSQSGTPTYSSFVEFDINAPDVLPSIINALMTKQQWSNDILIIDWRGNRTISVAESKISFSPPPSMSVKKGILSFSTALSSVSVLNEGKSLTFELVRCPNFTINFK